MRDKSIGSDLVAALVLAGWVRERRQRYGDLDEARAVAMITCFEESLLDELVRLPEATA